MQAFAVVCNVSSEHSCEGRVFCGKFMFCAMKPCGEEVAGIVAFIHACKQEKRGFADVDLGCDTVVIVVFGT